MAIVKDYQSNISRKYLFWVGEVFQQLIEFYFFFQDVSLAKQPSTMAIPSQKTIIIKI